MTTALDAHTLTSRTTEMNARKEAIPLEIEAKKVHLGQLLASPIVDQTAVREVQRTIAELRDETEGLDAALSALERLGTELEAAETKARIGALVNRHSELAAGSGKANAAAVAALTGAVELVRQRCVTEAEIGVLVAELQYQSALVRTAVPELEKFPAFPAGKAADLLEAMRNSLVEDHFAGDRRDWQKKLTLLQKNRNDLTGRAKRN